MRLTFAAAPALAVFLGLSGVQAMQAAPAPSAGFGYGQDRWDAPPRAYNQYQRSGFMDGMEGARKDVENHRRPDVNNRDEYRHPNVPGQFREAYRQGFREGYDRSMRHYMGGGPAYAPQGPAYAPQGPGYGRNPEAWEAPPSAYNVVQRRGFSDGIEGARRDFENHRSPDVNNRDEYRHPDFRGPDRRVYRDAFRRGYRMAASHLWGPGRY
ncbi:MAG TPA: hypothetical protein VG844_09380 [Terracidiphilus sp.]|nr:hypothetical protein [Terracidiphilus sp.]